MSAEPQGDSGTSGPVLAPGIVDPRDRDWALRRLFEPAAVDPRWRSLTPWVVVILGLLSSTMLWWSHHESDQRAEQDLAIEGALADLEVAVVSSHLWLEEFLTGDPEIDIQRDVFHNQEEALALVRWILRGGGSEDGAWLEPLRDADLRRRLEELEGHLIEFRDLALERYGEKEVAGIGSGHDQRYDATFRRVMASSKLLRSRIGTRLTEARGTARLQRGVILVAWMLAVGAAVAGLWHRERQRLRVEKTLRASQRWLATTLASLGDGVVATDTEGRVLFLNPEAEKLTGWSGEDALQRPIGEVVRVRSVAEGRWLGEPVAEALDGGGDGSPLSREATDLVPRSGEPRGVEAVSSPIRDDNHELLGAVLVLRDVSHRRRMEEELELRQAELRQAQKMEAVGRLAGGIAHDVNNYLGAIRGTCEVAMLKDQAGPELERRMGSAIATADKVSALIRQLLAFSRRQPQQIRVVDLNRVVRGLEPMIGRLIGDDVQLELRLDSRPRTLEIDPGQLEQVLVNLLVNARESMQNGGRIVVETTALGPADPRRSSHPELSTGHAVGLVVRDTGAGIAPEVRDKIFEPFFTTKSASGSSGLGLATVYGIVQQNGGSILCHSEVGEGTTFEILFPASDRGEDLVIEGTTGLAPGRQALDVLLVEDNTAMREAAETLFDHLGHRVTVASSGEEALEIAETLDRPDVLVTDVVMPGIDGRTLRDALHRRWPDLPCLFVSGYTDSALLRRGLDEESVHLLPKPFSLDELAQALERALTHP